MNRPCLNCYYGAISSWKFLFGGTQWNGYGFTNVGKTRIDFRKSESYGKAKIMKLRNSLNIVLIACLTMLLVFAMAGCREEPNPGQAADTESEGDKTQQDEKPIQQFFDYRLVETNAGVRNWVLDSDLMNKYSGQRDVELITVHIDFYRAGAHFSTLTADSGLANLQTNNIFTWGDVVVITEDGRKLETQELYFDNETQLIHNDVFDRFTRDGDVIEGIGLEATPDLDYIEIKQRVEASVLDNEQSEGGRR